MQSSLLVRITFKQSLETFCKFEYSQMLRIAVFTMIIVAAIVEQTICVVQKSITLII